MNEEEELAAIDAELVVIEHEIDDLQSRKRSLERRKARLKESAQERAAAELANQNWDRCDFPWSERLDTHLKDSFKISGGFRPLQRETMNVALSKHDVILIMPTGGGKSLCYQLPAMVAEGFTLVVSPLVALMEDQLMALKRLGINAALLNASSGKDEVNRIQAAMLDKKSGLRLLYVTPEKLAKSKRFMAKLQKAYGLGLFSHLAIDEVHCCSQWGHDFRPDYKFLGVMKSLFPRVPIMGLTATSTSRVTRDVQKILNIQNCIVFKASFNRPNLRYEVRPKPESQAECIDMLEDLLSNEFKGQSGIIYTLTIKDVESLAKELKGRGLKVGSYHASLEPQYRNSVHRKWVSGQYQAVIATIAFGMGIDKPDVRFVLHHCISKSMENFYQESGRAGRDDAPSTCITLFRFADIFRLSTMVFTEQTGLEKLYGMVAYCSDAKRCRRELIAGHFGEAWTQADCAEMCDHCACAVKTEAVDVTDNARAVVRILEQAAANDLKITALKLVDAVLGKGAGNLKLEGWKPKGLSKAGAEKILAFMLLEGYIKEDFHFTPYTTISYIQCGPRAGQVASARLSVTLEKSSASSSRVQKRKSSPKESTSKKQKASEIVIDLSDDDFSIE